MWKASALGFGILVGMSAVSFGEDRIGKCKADDYDCIGSLPGPHSTYGQGRGMSYVSPGGSHSLRDVIEQDRPSTSPGRQRQ